MSPPLVAPESFPLPLAVAGMPAASHLKQLNIGLLLEYRVAFNWKLFTLPSASHVPGARGRMTRIRDSGKRQEGSRQGRRGMSLLVAIDVATKSCVFEGKVRLKLQVALDELAEFFAIFVAHVHKLDAAAVGADIADDRREIDLAKAGTNLELDGIANAEFSRRFQIGAAQADSPHAGQARRSAFDLRAKRRFQGHADIAARDEVTRTGLCWRSKCPNRLLKRGAILDQGQGVFRSGPQACWLRVNQALAASQQR